MHDDILQMNAKSLEQAKILFRGGANTVTCLSWSGKYKETKTLREAEEFFIDSGDEPVKCDHKLYIEVNRDTGEPLTPEEQEGIVWRSGCREVTQEEIKEARDYFRKNHKCKCHLFYDEPSMFYDMRRCGVCGKTIAMV